MEYLLSVLLASGVLTFVAWRTLGAHESRAADTIRTPLRRAFATIRRPGESVATFVAAQEASADHALWLALTNQRLVLGSDATSLRAFERDAVSIDAVHTTWSDKREGFTVKAEGYDVKLTLPDGESYRVRLYASKAEDAGHERALASFLHDVGSPLCVVS